jgi:endonuclease/exonuclease/phosphatase family metal-dependent hydrolase
MSDADAVTLRVVTLNVHEFADAEMRCNIARLNAFLAPLAADLICLQEAVERSFRLRSREADLNLDDEEQSDLFVFARRLGFPHAVFGAAWHTSFGVAIFSRTPLLKCRVVTLSRHRVLLLTAVEKQGHVFTVSNVHLNHRSEKLRLDEVNVALDAIQADHFEKTLKNQNQNENDTVAASLFDYCAPLAADVDSKQVRDTRLPAMRAAADARLDELRTSTDTAAAAAAVVLVPGSILVGDFNSLSLPEHYLPQQWRHIQDSRRQANWEAPLSDVWRTVRRSSFVDLWLAARGEGELERAELVRFTCWAESRIDYVFAHEALLERCELTQCEVVPTTASDHSAVMATVRVKTTD